MFQVTQFPSVIELLKRLDAQTLRVLRFKDNNKEVISMKVENETQTLEVVPKRKGHGGRPRKDPSEKREPALMLRLNVSEQKRLQFLIKDYGWTGDPSSFVRDLILSEKGQAKAGGDLVALEHYLTLLHLYMSELEEELSEEQKDGVGRIKLAISNSAQAIYNNK